jgi:hypothetical protein
LDLDLEAKGREVGNDRGDVAAGVRSKELQLLGATRRGEGRDARQVEETAVFL